MGVHMSLPAIPLKEFDQEMASTRKLLERVPTEKGRWKPHEKSFALGHLAQLVSWMPGWIATSLREPYIDLAKGSGYSLESTDVLLKTFDAARRGDPAAPESPDSPPRSAHRVFAPGQRAAAFGVWADGG